MSATPATLALEQVRHAARVVRGGASVAGEVVERCTDCWCAGLAEAFVTPGLAVAREALGAAEFERRTDGAPGSELAGRLDAIAQENVRNLKRLAAILNDGDGARPQPAVLLGDAAVLLALYRSLAAFPARLWVVAPAGGTRRSTRSATVAVMSGTASDFSFAGIGRLAGPLRQYSATVEAGGRSWRVPTRELLVVLLAARVGDPESSPIPPQWPHLATALLASRDALDHEVVLELAAELNLAPKVHRGLAAARQLVPELGGQFSDGRLEIPWWERTIALPIAARRLLKESLVAERRAQGRAARTAAAS
jgi:hypothetical protein